METTANSEYTRCGHEDFEECFDEKGRCRDCRQEDEMDRPCPWCAGVGCEGFCEASGRCDCTECVVAGRLIHDPAPA